MKEQFQTEIRILSDKLDLLNDKERTFADPLKAETYIYHQYHQW